jgi:hypothetical protein
MRRGGTHRESVTNEKESIMHPVTHPSHARGTLSALMLGAMLCLAAAGARAADPAPAAGAMFSTTPVKPQVLDDDDCDDGAAPVAAAVHSWDVTPADKTLKAALTRWAAAAGWQLVWELPVDYAVSARTEINGGFTDAVETIARSMATADTPMKAIFYEGNRVLRIVAQ